MEQRQQYLRLRGNTNSNSLKAKSLRKVIGLAGALKLRQP